LNNSVAMVRPIRFAAPVTRTFDFEELADMALDS
jgi:hypothetical protein